MINKIPHTKYFSYDKITISYRAKKKKLRAGLAIYLVGSITARSIMYVILV